MRRIILATSVFCVLAGFSATSALAHVPGCHTQRCDRRVGAEWNRHHQRWGPLQPAHRATVYSGPCDGQSNHMADGTIIDGAGYLVSPRGESVDVHALASSFLALGTVIQFTHPVYGSRVWTVRDSGGAFDLYVPNCRYGSWGNPALGYRILLH